MVAFVQEKYSSQKINILIIVITSGKNNIQIMLYISQMSSYVSL